jgi:hypothetical protein
VLGRGLNVHVDLRHPRIEQEQPTDPARFYTPEAYRRLREVKESYDTGNLFRANHPIPPAD